MAKIEPDRSTPHKPHIDGKTTIYRDCAKTAAQSENQRNDVGTSTFFRRVAL
ncbi:hypothetical protein [Saccharibacillus sacchari]|uniref:Uncharacterized protein n=1 Tax=Saccharibacillus sacchari TaxID=456493 RepID=A0ACC6PDT2_9BACL